MESDAFAAFKKNYRLSLLHQSYIWMTGGTLSTKLLSETEVQKGLGSRPLRSGT